MQLWRTGSFLASSSLFTLPCTPWHVLRGLPHSLDCLLLQETESQVVSGTALEAEGICKDVVSGARAC